MNWTNRTQGADGASDVDTHVFVYKKDDDGNLIYQGGHIYYPEESQNFYVKDDVGNTKIQVILSWDDTTNEGSESCRKGEYIKIKKDKNYCSDEEYAKYYFVYCLDIYSKTYGDYEPNSSEHDSAVWNNVIINVTNNAGIVKPYNPQATTETANKYWCGLLINNNNVLSSADNFASTLNDAISALEFFYRPTPSNQGSHLPGKIISVTLPEFTDELPEIPKE